MALNLCRKTKFKTTAADILNLLPVAIFDILPTLCYRAQPSQTFTKISQLRLNIIIGPNFSNLQMTTVRHVRFSKTWFLTNESPWSADFAFGYQIWCKNIDRRRNDGPNRNPRWRPFAILELLHHHTGQSTKSFHWATSAWQILCKSDA